MKIFSEKLERPSIPGNVLFLRDLMVCVISVLENMVFIGGGVRETLWKKFSYAARIGKSVEEKGFEKSYSQGGN